MAKRTREEAAEELDGEVEKEKGGMVSLKRTKAEKKENGGGPVPSNIDPDYDYGTRISLNKTSLDKLGIDTLPKVGEKLHIDAMVEVVSISSNASKDSNSKSVEFQITDMKICE